LFERIDQIDGGEEPHLFALMLDGLHAQGGGDMALAGSGRGSVTMPGVRRSRYGSTIRFILDAVRSWWLRSGGGLLARNIWSLFNRMARSL
jgi:hypothetical protein